MTYLRRTRKKRGFTQEELAIKSGVLRSQISNLERTDLERGARKMTVRQAELLAQELDKDALGMVMKDRGDKINAAMQKKDARRVLELGAELVTLAQADDMPEKEIQKIEDELLKFIKKVAPDLVDEEDDEDEEEYDEDEDDEPLKKKPGKKSKKSRDRDDDEDIDRNPITGIRRNKDLEGADYSDDEDNEDEDDSPGRDALGNRVHKDL